MAARSFASRPGAAASVMSTAHQPHTLAVVFDLDDTLYAERDYIRSGYRAIDAHLRQSFDTDRLTHNGLTAGDWLWERFCSGKASGAFDALSETLELALTRDDIEITIPNGIIGNSKIINEAGGPSAKHRIRIPVGVAYGSDVDVVIAALSAVADNHTEVCKMPAARVRFRRFGDSSLDFEMLCWIDLPVNRGRMIHELNCAVYKSFQEEGIQIPFPQRDVHLHPVPENNT